MCSTHQPPAHALEALVSWDCGGWVRPRFIRTPAQMVRPCVPVPSGDVTTSPGAAVFQICLPFTESSFHNRNGTPNTWLTFHTTIWIVSLQTRRTHSFYHRSDLLLTISLWSTIAFTYWIICISVSWLILLVFLGWWLWRLSRQSRLTPAPHRMNGRSP